MIKIVEIADSILFFIAKNKKKTLKASGSMLRVNCICWMKTGSRNRLVASTLWLEWALREMKAQVVS